jgi:HK97 family phage major capsid protein
MVAGVVNSREDGMDNPLGNLPPHLRTLPVFVHVNGRVQRIDPSTLPRASLARISGVLAMRDPLSNFQGEDMRDETISPGAVQDELRRMFSDIRDEAVRSVKTLQGQVDEGLQARKDKEGELQARLLEVEQKLARRPATSQMPSAGSFAQHELAEALEASAELKAVASGRARRAVIDLPAGYFQASIVSGDGLALPDRLPGIVMPPQRRLTIRSLLPSIPVTSGSLQYTQETGFDNQAAPVSETTEKPESNITYELKTANVVVIAHFTRASLQVLADTPALMQQIGGRLVYGVHYVEDLQLLKGSGVGANIEGLLINATAYSGTTGDKVDTLRRAITQLEETDFAATGIVLNPSDWEEIQLTKDATGQYIVRSPGEEDRRMLWNLPVVSTSAMTEGDFLVADFKQSAVVLDRMEARLDVSTEDADNFTRNMATLRGEERIGLAKLRPGGLIKGTFST